MIEKTVTSYMNRKLDVPVYMGEKPTEKKKEYVVLSIIDNGRTDFIDAVTFNIRSYSTSLQKAAELNEKVKNAMFDIIEEPTISSSKCGGGGQNIDSLTKEYSYDTVFNLYFAE